LWTEKQAVLPNNGVFNVLLGSVNPLVNRLTNKGLFAEAGERHLAINVGNNPEIGKRIQITSVAYAIKSSQADKATTADTARVAQMAYSLNAATGTQTNAVFVANNGNVGIGTTGPEAILHVVNSALEKVPVFERSGANSDVVWTGARVLATKTSAIGDGFGSSLMFSNRAMGGMMNNLAFVGGVRDSADNSGALTFHTYTNGAQTEKMRITNRGNVYIGTNRPDSTNNRFKFQVVGDDFIGIFKSKTNGALLRLQTSEGPGNRVEMINRTDGLLAFSTGGFDRLVITKTGNVGIGGSPNNFPTAKLVVYGQIASMSPFIEVSDLRYKKNLAAIPNAIDKVTRLRGVSFDWRQEEFPELNFSKGRNLGFIAQEIKEVLPEVVSQDSKGYYSVAYSNVVPVLVEAIKEQQQTIAQLQMQLQKNEAELAGFKEKMSRIEAALQRLERLAGREENSNGRASGGEKMAGKEK
jgi:hypothetical protein